MLLSLLVCALAACQINAQMDPVLGQESQDSPQQQVNLKFGDMMMTKGQISALKRGENMGAGRNGFSAVNGNNLRWTDAVIPYEIDCSLEHLEDATTSIFAAMKEWEAKTCIRFVKHTNETYFLKFFRNTHCWGNVGMTSYTKISVGYGCEYQHVMTHEIGHVVGFYHEQNRKDRDSYVNVHWENIGQFRDAFDIVKNTDSMGVEYDYESIMHYPWSAFSSNGKDTMSPKRSLNGKVPYIALSDLDAKQTSLMYNCPAVEKKRQAARAKRHVGEIRTRRADSNDCQDDNKYCPDWAAAGFCSNDPYTQQHCKLSCDNNCLARNCIDQRTECPEWESWGHCTLNPTVAKLCVKSCNQMCKGTKPTSPPVVTTKSTTVSKGPTKPTQPTTPRTFPTGKPTGDKFLGKGIICKDGHHKCPEWAKQGECKRNPGYMLKNCEISCKQFKSCDKGVLKPPGSCANPLGLSDDGSGKFNIPDSAFYSPGHLAPGSGWAADAKNARLYFRDDYTNKRIGAWCAKSHDQAKSDTEGYVQVDLGTQKTISFIATQGRDKYFERVGQFKIQYSDDGSNFKTYQEGGKDKIFEGNCDHVHPVLNEFKTRITAQYIRYLPWQWNYPCMRMELYGC